MKTRVERSLLAGVGMLLLVASGDRSTENEPYQPPEAASLLLWLEASSLSELYRDGEVVERWPDQSAKGNHAEGTDGPTFTDAAMAGLPAVSFEGRRGQHLSVGKKIGRPYSYTIVAILSTRDLRRRQMAFGASTSGAAPTIWGLFDLSNATRLAVSYFFGDGGSHSYGATGVLPIQKNTPFLYTKRYVDGETSESAFFNGVETRVTASRASSSSNRGTPQVFSIGRLGNFRSNPWNGHIAELLVYEVALSAEDRESLEHDLMEKFSIGE